MSRAYYYLLASLPQLNFRGDPPVTEENFLEECEKWLSPGDMREITALGGGCLTEKCRLPVLTMWRDFDLSLRKELAEYREERVTGVGQKPASLAGKILEQANPLEMEKWFEKTKWDFLENLAGGHFFDIERLVIYYLQLRILVRLETFNKDKGETYFHEICEVKYDNAKR